MDAKHIGIKIVKELDKWIDRAAYGHYDDYSHILHMISFMHAWNEIEPIGPLYEYFLYGDD